MGKIIAVSNQKGGVGKTTTCVNLTASLVLLGKRSLLIDFDPQGNSTGGFGIDKQLHPNIYHVLVEGVPIRQAIRNTMIDDLCIATANIDLSGAEIELVNTENRTNRLKESLQEIVDDYDFIFIDCPPSLGLLTINSLVAAESILIPLQCEYYAMEGMSQLLVAIEEIKKIYNPTLSIEGILPTMFDSRNNISKQVLEELKLHFRDYVFQSIIPRNVRLSEAPSFGMPVALYNRNSKGSTGYFSLAAELIAKYSK